MRVITENLRVSLPRGAENKSLKKKIEKKPAKKASGKKSVKKADDENDSLITGEGYNIHDDTVSKKKPSKKRK